MSVAHLVRADLRDFTLYTPASSNDDCVRLHANELPWRGGDDVTDRGLNRYPPSRDGRLVERLARLYGVAPACVLPTRGSDDGIDLLVRTFCTAGRDRIVTTSPGFAMYAAFARLQGCATDTVPLLAANNFTLATDALLSAVTATTKLVFVCSPNNPTGGVISPDAIDQLCRELAGTAIVIVDEAYAEFSAAPSATERMQRHDNLVVLRTLSKAFGLAGARVGAVIGSAQLVATLDRLLTPYPLPTQSVDAALAATAVSALSKRRAQWALIRSERQRLADALATLPGVDRVWPGEGNFVLIQLRDARARVAACREHGYLVRYLGGTLNDGLRISVGTSAQNDGLLKLLGTYQ